MKTMKRISSLLLALCLVFCLFSFVSCNNNSEGNTGNSQNAETQNAIDIKEYVIVVPTEASTTLRYAASNLALLVNQKFGVTLSVVNDSTAPVSKEILIGDTNREESKTSASLGQMQYLVLFKNEKIVLKGNGIYVGAACGDFINKYAKINAGSTVVDITSVPRGETLLTYSPATTAKSVIFMIGDGMGDNHILMSEANGLDGFAAKEFPFIGQSITRSQSVINKDAAYTDSAASGTAMSTGYKTINGFIGLDKNGNSVPNVRELAYMAGAKTGVITTDVITGATPTAYLCHCESRHDEASLQSQINELIAQGKVDYCSGSVDNNLTTEVANALALLSKNSSSFFLMVEEGYIDKFSHSNDHEDVIDCVIRFDDSIEYATQYALCHPDVALIVTADHETGKLLPGPTALGYGFRTSNHTNINVPIFAIGAGTGVFSGKTIENIELAKFCASVYSNETFGQTEPIE